ncbi:MAG: hypothetical protein ABI112_16330 [Terracoccus sp.]
MAGVITWSLVMMTPSEVVMAPLPVPPPEAPPEAPRARTVTTLGSTVRAT